MKRLQKWFEQLAGITQQELDRLAQVREVFGNSEPDISALERPACWRRRCRIRP